tara:strand:+ start:426 stop:1841 length:1416 start_codon:yes stop_codon:yes gene_type:complete
VFQVSHPSNPQNSMTWMSKTNLNSLPRREFMQVGGLALGGLTLPEVLAAKAASGNLSKRTSVIMLYQHGGASQFETYDLKPEAPSAIRSQFAPISTNVPGMDICELFPLQAKIADKFSLIRSLHHEMSSHSDGGITVLTGKAPLVPDPTSTSRSDHPDFGSVASRVLGTGPNVMPPYVAIPRKPYMTQPAYLGLHHGAFEVGDPNAKGFRAPHVGIAAGKDGKRLGDRKTLIDQLDRIRRTEDLRGNLAGVDQFRDLAFEMLTSPESARAFDLTEEPDTLRDRYGRNLWGQSCLLARRLAQAGTSVINIYFNTPKTGPDFTNWDDHPGNATRPGHFAKYMKVRLPYMDQALATLVEDIHSRDLQREILVVVVGEFGRTPVMRYGPPNRSFGRDHWPQAYSALVAGGNLRMGQVVGATNSKSEYPSKSPYTPQDLLATIYHHLGIDHERTFDDFGGRPVHILNQAKPIAELV